MAKKPATPKSVTLASTLDHPVTISYDGEALILPPRGKAKNIEPSKLGALPKGVRAK